MDTNAEKLDSYGLNVLPARPGGKAPIIKWMDWQERRTTDKLKAWFAGGKNWNYWIMTGAISAVVVLDCDTEEAVAYWRETLGDEILDATTCVKTSKGYHWWFRLEGHMQSWSHHDDETNIHFDVRADGTGVIAPPSVHESGHVYEWVRDLDEIQMMPTALRGADKSNKGLGSGNTRSMLAKLLDDPPQGVGGRNEWLARIAGHYAKAHRTMEDLYRVECVRANSMLDPPLDEREFTKTIESIWRSEQAKEQLGIEAGPDNGWLISAGDHLLTPVRFKQGDEWTIELRQWANFDMRVLGIMDSDEGERAYDVEVHRKLAEDTRIELLPASVIGHHQRFRSWTANLGIQVTPPPEKQLAGNPGAEANRIQSYLDSQEAPRFQMVGSLGWHAESGGFICHEGVIRASGMGSWDGIKPDPILRNRAPYRYGIMDEQEAVRVLREILTFHFETEASVFGAWWAACLLKPQFQRMVSQFPFMALEAPSESGKTTGYYGLMIQLAGNIQGQTMYTPAALRDALSAHHSGIVWIDDEDSIEPLQKLLRATTAEGSMTKKNMDTFGQETVRMVAPVLVSGEALQLGDQKALRDRAIMLEVHTPTARRSTHGDYPQWDDILTLRAQYPDLSVMAGNMVQLALRHADTVLPMVAQLRGVEAGKRHGDKVGLLRAGARLLALMTGDPGHVDQVDNWLDEQGDLEDENSLTLKLLPSVLLATGFKQHPEIEYNGLPTPVIYHPFKGMWFSVRGLAQWWEMTRHGRVQVRTESYDSIRAQVKAAGWSHTRRVRVSGDRGVLPYYVEVPDDIAALVLARAQGGSTGSTSDGTGQGQLDLEEES